MADRIILFAEMDGKFGGDLRRNLAVCSLNIVEIPLGSDAISNFQAARPDLVIIGCRQVNAWEGLAAARKIRSFSKKVPIILVTELSSVEQVIAALRAGVDDYFNAPFLYEELVASVKQKLGCVRASSTGDRTCRLIVGESSRMREIKSYLLKIAPTNSTVFITGETGTGKELMAEQIRLNSSRRDNPFICINCTALPENLLESELFGFERGAFTGAHSSYSGKLKLADGGTVFLDEIGEMNPHSQAKILRVIENKEFYRVRGEKSISLDVRFIAAANRDPEQLVREGKLREDLYYRLNVARIHVPPLRDRKEDIPLLLDHYIGKLNSRFGSGVKGFTEEALSSLIHYNWPGNVRELKNILEAIFIDLPGRKISLGDLPEHFLKRIEDAAARPESERDRLIAALFATNWNKSKAAEKLQWSRMTLYRKMAKFHIITKPDK